MRQTFAQINLKNLKSNYKNIRKQVKGAGVMAVVKADAYGHGMKETVKALNLMDDKPEYYAVAYAEEGAELAGYQVKQPILIFDTVTKYNIDTIIKKKLIPTVTNDKQVSIIKNNCGDKRIKVHVNVDTGMGRIGVSYLDAFEFIKKLSKKKYIKIDGIYTHFATSDEKNKRFAELQLRRFTYLLLELKQSGIKYGKAHAANSGAILDMPDSYFDMVRPGISLYGYYPSQTTSESIKLKPVMSLISTVSSVRKFEKSVPVSYGRKYYTPKKTTIISVPIGYADGVPRYLTNKMKAIVRDKIYPQAGTVTMDRIMFDAGKDKINGGDKVILIGSSKKKSIDAWDWCEILKTIPYEITCGISRRVPRTYTD